MHIPDAQVSHERDKGLKASTRSSGVRIPAAAFPLYVPIHTFADLYCRESLKDTYNSMEYILYNLKPKISGISGVKPEIFEVRSNESNGNRGVDNDGWTTINRKRNGKNRTGNKKEYSG